MGATYTRQSSAGITDGAVIEASDLNDEFDQLLAAFVAASGHTHDGTAAEGGPITKLLGTAITIGDATAGTDIAVTFDGETGDGVLTWMEDEDYFKFSDEVLMNSTEKLLFGDTGTYIHQSADGVLDLVSDTEIEINATTIDINGAVAMDGAITGATNITLSGELDAATLDISGNADIDGTLEADAITINSTAIGSIYGVIAGSSSIVTTGALDSGSITSGFGTIDTGSSTITTTGLISGGSLDIDNVLINGTTIGHTDDTDLITLADGVATVAGELDATTLDISGNADIDGTTNLDAVDIDGAVQLDSTLTVGVNDTGYDVKLFGATSGAYMLWDESTDDLILAGAAKLYLYDAAGGENISSDGTDLTLAAGADLNLTATTDINVPSGVGMTFGNDGEKIEGDGTDLTIASSAALNLTATTDVVIPANVGITFGSGEKIEGDSTDLTITSGAKINLTATSDIVVPADVGITFGTGEKIEGNSTDLTVTSGADINLTATADVNLPNDVGMVFGDDGEKIEGDGTDLTISSSAVATIDAGTDIVLDADGADIFLKDGGTLFGTFTNSGTQLVIKSSSSGTTALTFSGANATFAGTLATAAGGFNVAGLDIDGATDIGADIVDADLFIIDDGAGGTNRKTTAARVKTYIGGGTSWQAVKTGNFTASAGQGVFVNTTSAAITITLPAGTIGDEVSIIDYAGTADSNNITVAANGSEKIHASTDDLTVATERAAFTLVFTDSTQGWLLKDK